MSPFIPLGARTSVYASSSKHARIHARGLARYQNAYARKQWHNASSYGVTDDLTRLKTISGEIAFHQVISVSLDAKQK